MDSPLPVFCRFYLKNLANVDMVADTVTDLSQQARDPGELMHFTA